MQLAKYPRVLYDKPSNKMYVLYFMSPIDLITLLMNFKRFEQNKCAFQIFCSEVENLFGVDTWFAFCIVYYNDI